MVVYLDRKDSSMDDQHAGGVYVLLALRVVNHYKYDFDQSM